MIIDGKDLNVKEEQFEISQENWNSYQLYDGGTVRLKTTLVSIYRVLDINNTPAFKEDGSPHFVVKTHILVT